VIAVQLFPCLTDCVSFNRIVNGGSFTNEEYLSRAIHHKDHPEHKQFLDILKDPIFKDPCVFIGNLTEFLNVS